MSDLLLMLDGVGTSSVSTTTDSKKHDVAAEYKEEIKKVLENLENTDSGGNIPENEKEPIDYKVAWLRLDSLKKEYAEYKEIKLIKELQNISNEIIIKIKKQHDKKINTALGSSQKAFKGVTDKADDVLIDRKDEWLHGSKKNLILEAVKKEMNDLASLAKKPNKDQLEKARTSILLALSKSEMLDSKEVNNVVYEAMWLLTLHERMGEIESYLADYELPNEERKAFVLMHKALNTATGNLSSGINMEGLKEPIPPAVTQMKAILDAENNIKTQRENFNCEVKKGLVSKEGRKWFRYKERKIARNKIVCMLCDVTKAETISVSGSDDQAKTMRDTVRNLSEHLSEKNQAFNELKTELLSARAEETSSTKNKAKKIETSIELEKAKKACDDQKKWPRGREFLNDEDLENHKARYDAAVERLKKAGANIDGNDYIDIKSYQDDVTNKHTNRKEKGEEYIKELKSILSKPNYTDEASKNDFWQAMSHAKEIAKEPLAVRMGLKRDIKIAEKSQQSGLTVANYDYSNLNEELNGFAVDIKQWTLDNDCENLNEIKKELIEIIKILKDTGQENQKLAKNQLKQIETLVELSELYRQILQGKVPEKRFIDKKINEARDFIPLKDVSSGKVGSLVQNLFGINNSELSGLRKQIDQFQYLAWACEWKNVVDDYKSGAGTVPNEEFEWDRLRPFIDSSKNINFGNNDGGQKKFNEIIKDLENDWSKVIYPKMQQQGMAREKLNHARSRVKKPSILVDKMAKDMEDNLCAIEMVKQLPGKSQALMKRCEEYILQMQSMIKAEKIVSKGFSAYKGDKNNNANRKNFLTYTNGAENSLKMLREAFPNGEVAKSNLNLRLEEIVEIRSKLQELDKKELDNMEKNATDSAENFVSMFLFEEQKKGFTQSRPSLTMIIMEQAKQELAQKVQARSGQAPVAQSQAARAEVPRKPASQYRPDNNSYPPSREASAAPKAAPLSSRPGTSPGAQTHQGLSYNNPPFSAEATQPWQSLHASLAPAPASRDNRPAPSSRPILGTPPFGAATVNRQGAVSQTFAGSHYPGRSPLKTIPESPSEETSAKSVSSSQDEDFESEMDTNLAHMANQLSNIITNVEENLISKAPELLGPEFIDQLILARDNLYHFANDTKQRVEVGVAGASENLRDAIDAVSERTKTFFEPATGHERQDAAKQHPLPPPPPAVSPPPQPGATSGNPAGNRQPQAPSYYHSPPAPAKLPQAAGYSPGATSTNNLSAPGAGSSPMARSQFSAHPPASTQAPAQPTSTALEWFNKLPPIPTFGASPTSTLSTPGVGYSPVSGFQGAYPPVNATHMSAPLGGTYPSAPASQWAPQQPPMPTKPQSPPAYGAMPPVATSPYAAASVVPTKTSYPAMTQSRANPPTLGPANFTLGSSQSPLTGFRPRTSAPSTTPGWQQGAMPPTIVRTAAPPNIISGRQAFNPASAIPYRVTVGTTSVAPPYRQPQLPGQGPPRR